MLKDNLNINQCQKYKYPHGAVYIGPSDETISCGFLEIAPDRATNQIIIHLPEHIKQISGISEIEMFDADGRVSINRLKPGETFMIPSNTLHVHRNRDSKTAINYWEYQGNAATFVTQMRAGGISIDNNLSSISSSQSESK